MRPMRLALTSCSLRHCQPFHRLLIFPSLRAQSAVRLLDENGQPFKGVQVCTWMRDAPAGSRESRGECAAAAAPTDGVGQFRIDHVAMGEIVVEAIKPEDGYVAFAGTGSLLR